MKTMNSLYLGLLGSLAGPIPEEWQRGEATSVHCNESACTLKNKCVPWPAHQHYSQGGSRRWWPFSVIHLEKIAIGGACLVFVVNLEGWQRGAARIGHSMYKTAKENVPWPAFQRWSQGGSRRWWPALSACPPQTQCPRAWGGSQRGSGLAAVAACSQDSTSHSLKPFRLKVAKLISEARI